MPAFPTSAWTSHIASFGWPSKPVFIFSKTKNQIKGSKATCVFVQKLPLLYYKTESMREVLSATFGSKKLPTYQVMRIPIRSFLFTLKDRSQPECEWGPLPRASAERRHRRGRAPWLHGEEPINEWGPLVGERGRELSESVVYDIWVLQSSFPKTTVNTTKWPYTFSTAIFPQLFFHNLKFIAVFFQKSQLN